MRTSLEHPVDARGDRDTESKADQCHESCQDGNLRSSELTATSRPLSELAGAYDSDTSPSCDIPPDNHRAQTHQHEREGARGGNLKWVELREDLGRERPVGQYLERPVLGEDHE